MIRVVAISAALFCLSPDIYASWSYTERKDVKTGKTSAFAISKHVTSTEPMQLPYKDTRSWIGYGCSELKEWVYFGFTKQPNLQPAQRENGYNVIEPRLTFGDSLSSATLTQDWGSKMLEVVWDDKVIEKLVSNKEALLELNWLGQGTKYFRYDLSGAEGQINNAKKKCKLPS